MNVWLRSNIFYGCLLQQIVLLRSKSSALEILKQTLPRREREYRSSIECLTKEVHAGKLDFYSNSLNKFNYTYLHNPYIPLWTVHDLP